MDTPQLHSVFTLLFIRNQLFNIKIVEQTLCQIKDKYDIHVKL